MRQFVQLRADGNIVFDPGIHLLKARGEIGECLCLIGKALDHPLNLGGSRGNGPGQFDRLSLCLDAGQHHPAGERPQPLFYIRLVDPGNLPGGVHLTFLSGQAFGLVSP